MKTIDVQLDDGSGKILGSAVSFPGVLKNLETEDSFSCFCTVLSRSKYIRIHIVFTLSSPDMRDLLGPLQLWTEKSEFQ
ncbi:MAG: hypothetical protein E5X53_24575 [Mesorhizobium sp.]|uniref:hypothetical protein n=1 Tax=Mesorhizobium sp. TaxID=1871066 RepID=UPI000FE5429C|nr:hypothetical protein [Mesorhizobium sp.]RWM23168.1 MAG: hypothetical protein EOR73_03140 [Mesorhizobium sp.]TIP70978.1 MAG: hypothetical protein E5X55_24985 [Mesorhizobium sp.]TIQ08442.1 MAG: hypothetical protein E5X57_23460 [Mesorhizobium sp.]TIR49393.1 MAG: hypothetical protein E5X53_24575 [Mesorhizobium sp.]TJV95078.1 MAG: hypothetical protein E5X52_25920 [Mesorhizobium sp.]